MDFYFIHLPARQNLLYSLKESEIRPKAIFDEYLRLAKIDTVTYFAHSTRTDINCPACNIVGKHAFNKNNFDYCECNICRTLYVSPRPEAKAVTDYYTNSPSSKYWAITFYKETADARREKIWKPKAKMIADELEKLYMKDCQIIDIGGGYGIFAEEIKKISTQPVMVIEPTPHLAEICRDKGFEVIEKFLETVSVNDLPNGPKCFVSFELFEHLHNPEIFLLKLNNLMQSNDLFIFTTLSGTGLDIQVLWGNSQSVSPPHHLNFFNPYSIKMLLGKTGFKSLEITTPGKLDIDILNNNKEHVKNRFWKTFIEMSDDEQKLKWQSIVSESGFSSHMMVICQKS